MLVTLSMMLAVYGVVGGNEAGWTSARTLGLLAGAAALLAVFVAWESRTASPLVPLRLFALRNVSISQVVGVLWAGAMFAWFFLATLYLQQVLGYGALDIGLAFLPTSLVMAYCSLKVSDRLVMRFGIRPPLVAGLACAAAQPAAVLAGPRRRELRDRRTACPDPDGHRRRHRLQPGPAGGHGRRRAAREPVWPPVS